MAFAAEAHLLLRDNATAIPLLERVVDAEPDNYEALLLLTQALGETRNYEAMLQRSAAARATQPDEPRALYLSGVAAHGAGDAFTAIAHLTRCLALSEHFAAALRLRAEILIEMQQWSDALTDTEALLAAEATRTDAHLVLHARVLSAMQRSSEAIAYYEEAIAQNPFCDEAILSLAATLAAGGDLTRALAVLDEALTHRPDFARALKARGAVRHALHDEAGAAADLKQALTIDPELATEIEGTFTTLDSTLTPRPSALNPRGL